MKAKPKAVLLLSILMLTFSCTEKNKVVQTVKGDNFELKIAPEQKAVLILFPCFPCDIENTKTEAKFLKDLEKKGITTLLLGYNKRLFLSENEKTEYSKAINSILDKNDVDKKNVFIGGFSGGGNISVLLGNHLIKTRNEIEPKGIFVVDSPLDVEQLYKNAKYNLAINADKEAVEEAKFIVQMLEESIGKPETNRSKYQELSPYLISDNSISNIENLKNVKVRFYSEIDSAHMKIKQRKYEDLNAYMLEKMSIALKRSGNTKVELIKTKNRGIRANGTKNPHSWNLVEREDLLKWMTED